MVLKALILGGGIYALHRSYQSSRTQTDRTNQLQDKLDRALAEIESLKQRAFGAPVDAQRAAAPPEYGVTGSREVGKREKEGIW